VSNVKAEPLENINDIFTACVEEQIEGRIVVDYHMSASQASQTEAARLTVVVFLNRSPFRL
jgi:hypothetical protein